MICSFKGCKSLTTVKGYVFDTTGALAPANACDKHRNDDEFFENKNTVAATKPDSVNHPKHYTAGKVECIDALEAATERLTGIEAVCTANAIKYLWRWKQKNGVEDLRKAQWYINRLIERVGANEDAE